MLMEDEPEDVDRRDVDRPVSNFGHALAVHDLAAESWTL
jgi:hypothetical protein